MSVNYSNQLHLLNEKVKNENYLPEEEWFNSVNDILKTNENSNITCEILANLCRLDEGRKLCHEKLDYEIVLNLFKDNFNKQYFRLVANITYESGETRQKLLKCENISNLNHVVVLINKKESQDFIKAIVGMVLNLCIDSFNFCSMFIKAGVLNCVLNVLKDSENALYTDLSWQLLSVLSASGSSQILSDDFVDFLIINLNNKSTENSILEYVFEILTNIIVDNDKCMKLMIDKKCFETLLNQNDTYLEKSLKLVVFLSSYDNCIDEIDSDLVSKKLFYFLKYKDTIYEYVMLIFGNLCRNKNFNVKCVEMNLANEITVKINEKCSPDILYALCATLKNLLVIKEHRSIVLQNNPLPTISNVFIEEKGALRIKLMAIARFLVIDEENYKHKMYLLDRLDFVTVLVNTGRDTCLDFVREEAIRLLVVLSTKRDHSNFSIIKDVLIELKKRCKREDIPDFETCQ